MMNATEPHLHINRPNQKCKLQSGEIFQGCDSCMIVQIGKVNACISQVVEGSQLAQSFPLKEKCEWYKALSLQPGWEGAPF